MQQIPGILGCLLGGLALLIVLFRGPPDSAKGSFSEMKTTTDPSLDRWNESQSILNLDDGDFQNIEIEAAIDEALEAKFADTEWLSERLVEISMDPKGSDKLRKAMGRRNQYHRIDLSEYSTTEAKVDAVLARFVGQNHYSSNNDLVKQMREMGPESVDILMDRLDHLGAQDWTQRMAINDALEDRIPEGRREAVIRHFRRSGAFVDFITKYQVTEVEDELMGVVAGTQNFEDSRFRGSSRKLMEAAIQMNPERAEKALLEHVKYGNQPGEAAALIASLPDVDPVPAIEAAIPRTSNQYERSRMVSIALEHGAQGSLELAERSLRETANSDHLGSRVREAVRLHTGAIGDPIDVADWIAANRDRFVWNPEARAYVLP